MGTKSIKCFSLLGLLLVLGLAVAPSISADNQRILEKGNIIIVDDEGDGDYTSIMDAVNNSTHNDTIEVYSGTYVEDDIRIEPTGLTLVGIPYELGTGSDIGRPTIIRKGVQEIFMIKGHNVTIDGFIMEDSLEQHRYHWHFIDYIPLEIVQ